VAINVSMTDNSIVLSVRDDGVGLNPSHRRRGLGLIGIEERVKELDGTVVISPGGTRGTIVAVTLPLPSPAPEAALARAVS
jgi:signal transduction histidine kinase